MAEHKLKVILEDGDDARELVWASMSSNEVYGGVPSEALHTSYHGSGRRHTRSNNSPAAPLAKDWRVPLTALEGVEQLQLFAFRPEPCWHEEGSGLRKYHGAKYHTGMKLDARTLDRNAAYNIRVGIVGIKGDAALKDHQKMLTGLGQWTVEAAEVYRNSSPWLYTLLCKYTGATPPAKYEPLPAVANGFVPEPEVAASGDLAHGWSMTIHFIKGRTAKPGERWRAGFVPAGGRK